MNMTAKLASVVAALAWTGLLVADTLPEGYKEVRWIESSGTQWIDTELRPNCTDTVEVKYMMPLPSGKFQFDQSFIYCARDVDHIVSFTCARNGERLRFDRKGTVVGNSGWMKAYTPYTLTVNGKDQTYFLNDDEITCTKTTGDFTVGGDFILFGGYSGDKTVVSNLGVLRLYSFKVTAADGVVRADLVPCVREKDGEVGLYDRARNAFYGNAGTGSFDSDIIRQRHRLPSIYQKCYWIESSGLQWIDTQVRPRCEDTVETKFYVPALSSTSGFLYCARGVGNVNTFTCVKQPNNILRFDRGDSSVGSASKALVKEGEYELTVSGKDQTYLLNDDNVSCQKKSDPFVVGGDFVLLGGYSGDKTSVVYPGIFRLYSFKVITAEGDLRADLIPCIRKEDQKPGLYDLVNERFLVNGGQGEFTFSAIPVKGLVIFLK